MILSASRRTDIPCFYAEWFMNRLRAGYALTRNPMNHAQLSRVALSPETVDCIVFWTKDPRPLLPYLDELDQLRYRYYFQFTLTPYDAALERNLRPKVEIEDTFMELSRRIGPERVIWRYDPILLTQSLRVADHRVQFARLCEKLSSFTDTVTISFVDLYAKLKRPAFRPPTREEAVALAAFMGETAKVCGLRAVACCEAGDLTAYGIGRAACIDPARVARLGGRASFSADRNQRPGCGCCQSVDIGAYNTCGNGCVYCYANHGAAAIQRRRAQHDAQGELLIGRVEPGERVTERS